MTTPTPIPIPPTARAAAAITVLASESPVVLLVDDQMIIGEAVRRMLAAQQDIVFHFCQKAEDALATAARVSPTVILQDLVMPGADGLDLVRGYRQQEETSLTPLIVLSSKEDGITKAEAFARGANDYIVKLPDPVELVARIRYHSRGYLSLLQRNEAFDALHRTQAALAAELAKAAAYVRSMLPAPVVEPIAIDWHFVPSATLGGDCFDYFWIDDDHLALYLLDVCGHGVGPALLSVSAMNTIRSRAVYGGDLRDPSGVLRHLNAAFPMDQHHNMFFTIWYGVYKRSTRTLSYSGGGHPPPLLITEPPVGGATADRRIEQLLSPGPPIGVAPDEEFPTVSTQVPPNSMLLVYSDGAIEVWSEPSVMWGIDGIMHFAREHSLADRSCLDELYKLVQSMSESDILSDDFSAFLARFP